MRLKLTLKIVGNKQLPLNYNYPLSATIYKLLQFGSPAFSEFLHEIGFQEKGKSYKLFSFALRFNKIPEINNNRFYLKSENVSLFISSPLIDTFIQNFIIGTFENQFIEINYNNINSKFVIEQVESLPAPIFSNTSKFTLLSPLVIATKKESNGKLIPRYFRYYDDINEINRVFNQNLINKYKLVHNKDYQGNGIKFSWDTNYIDKRLAANKKVTKLITVTKKGGIVTNIKANEIPFTLVGDIELIKIGYECGFGSQNSLGFGLADAN